MAKILYISNTGSMIGGAENQLCHLVKKLDKHRYNPIVLCPGDGEFADKLRAEKIPTVVLHLPAWRKVKSMPFRRIASNRLVDFVVQNEIDLIHSNLWMNYYIWKVSQKTGIPTVSHVRDLIRTQRIHKYLFDKIDRIISISSQLKQPLVQAGIPDEKIDVIPNGVDLSEFTCDGRERNVLRRDFPHLENLLVGIVGRIEPFKGQKEFIQAAAEVLKARQDVSFLLIGVPSGRDRYAEEVKGIIAERGIEKHIIFTGFRRDMPDVMASLDILVSASAGSVIMEAMSAGKPVIGTRIASAPEVIEDGVTGLLIPHKDTYAMAQAILRLLNDQNARQRMGQAGRKLAEEKFSFERNVQQTQTIYDIL